MKLFQKIEAGLGEGPPDESEKKLLKSKKKAPTMTTSTSNIDDSSVTLPHLIYKLDFCETEMSEQSVWAGNDVLAGIIKQSREELDENNPTEKKTDSKVVVVLELPSGGAVTKFVVGDNDDTLEVEVQKHTLMLNPKALLFSGIRAGVLDQRTDGPNTARGGIRLSECAKALHKYRSKEKSRNKNSNTSNKKGLNSLHLVFDLPDYVERDSVDYYSYCFEQNQYNPLQYAIAYFEFEVKDPNKAEKKEQDKFTTASSMIFDDGGSNGNNTNPQNNQQRNGHGHNNNGQSFTSNTTNNSSSSSSNSSRAYSHSARHAPNEDVGMMDVDGGQDDDESNSNNE